MLTIGLVGLAALILMILLGVPLAFSIGLVAVVGNTLILGIEIASVQLYLSAFEATTQFILLAIPLFVFMGQLVALGGIGRDLYNFIYRWLGWLPGGLAISTVVSCAGLGALTGVSAAGVATLAPVALPQMERYKYASSLAAGSLASASALAILIPPSIAFIVYGVWTETSILKLFMAGLVPGVLLAFLFCVYIFIVALIRPDIAPRGAPEDMAEGASGSAMAVLPILTIFLLLIGGLYFGWFTPSEGAAVASVAVIGILALLGRLNFKMIRKSAESAARVTVMIFAIVVMVQTFARFLVLTGLPGGLTSLLTTSDFAPLTILVLILLAYLVLGMVLDTVGMILLTLPFFFPVITALGYDPIWFGVILVLMIEIGLLTPPVGLNCYLLSAIAPEVGLRNIFIGVLPFVAISLLVVAFLILFPGVVLWLPNQFG